MEAASYSTNNSYSSSSSSSSSSLQQARRLTSSVAAVQPAFHASLHSVRKPMAKPWKKPIAPLPPTPPRVYKVDPVNFRDLVQKLTGAPELIASPQSDHQLIQLPHRLHRVAPPPLSLAAPSPLSRAEVSAPIMNQKLFFSDNTIAMPMNMITPSSPSLGMLNLSPSSYNWCNSFPILSPGTLSTLEQSTVP